VRLRRRVRRALLHVHGGHRPGRPPRAGRVAERLRAVLGHPPRPWPRGQGGARVHPAGAPPQRVPVPGGPAPARVAGADTLGAQSRPRAAVPARDPVRATCGPLSAEPAGHPQPAGPVRTHALDGPDYREYQVSSPETSSGDLIADTEAVVLVGGKGTRLRPLTISAPKPMLPTAGLPFLTHLLSRIRAAGIGRVVLGTSYKAEVFEEHFGDGSDLDLEISYVVETEPLGTGGGIRNVLDHVTASTVMVFNGDVLGGTDLRKILDLHHAKQADLTMHLVRVSDPRAFGCVTTDDDG